MTLAGTGDIVAVDAVRATLEQENALLRDLVQRRADEAVAAIRREDEALRFAAELVGQIADLCDEADSEAEQIGWSLGGLVSTGELRAAIGLPMYDPREAPESPPATRSGPVNGNPGEVQ